MSIWKTYLPMLHYRCHNERNMSCIIDEHQLMFLQGSNVVFSTIEGLRAIS